MGATNPPNGSARPQGIHDVNVTPIIDVALVLVVILLVATPMAFQSGIAVRNAAAVGKKSEEKTREERIEITIVSPDSLIVNSGRLRRTALGETIGPLLATSTTRSVVVRCGDDVPHGAFVGVIDEAKALGAAQIAVVGG